MSVPIPQRDSATSTGGNGRSSVHPRETSSQSVEKSPENASKVVAGDAIDAIDWRHRGEGAYRRRIITAMHALMLHPDRIAGFQYCGHSAWIARHRDDPDRYCIMCERCHDRWCKACSRDRSRRLTASVMRLIDGRPARYITLTYRSTPDDRLRGLIDQVTECFARLRRTKLWMSCVVGGVSFLECKWIADTQRWHVHLHMIVRGRYLAQQQLAEAWHRTTGHSYVVDIRAVRSAHDVAQYISGYVTKGVGTEVVSDHVRLVEAIKALKGVRLATTFGEWRGEDLIGKGTLTADDWEYVEDFNDAMVRARAGSQPDRDLIAAVMAGMADGPYELRWDCGSWEWHPPPDDTAEFLHFE